MSTLKRHLPILIGALILSLAQTCAAQCSPRPQDIVWLVDTRGAACPGTTAGKEPKLSYSRFDHGRWVAATQADFLATDDASVPTCFFLHGNQVDIDSAGDMGMTVYSQLVAHAQDNRPLRMVIFSWPSERIRGGPLKDVRTKAHVSDTAGYQLAWLLDKIDPAVKVTLIGYSFGARSVTGALELLGGGRLAGNELPSRAHTQRTPTSVVLMAAALDDDWLLPGERDERALSQMDRLLLVNNSCDWVLRHYRLLYCGGCAVALGHAGINTSCLPAAEAAKIREFDACCDVGKKHDWSRYAFSDDVMSRVRPYVFAPASIQSAQANAVQMTAIQ